MAELMTQVGAPYAYVCDKGLRDGVALDVLTALEAGMVGEPAVA
jgi:hypothetical protein